MNRGVQALRSWTFGLFILAIFAFASSAPHIARAYEGPMWPPDRAVFDRLQASADSRIADYLIAVICKRSHAGERGFLVWPVPPGHKCHHVAMRQAVSWLIELWTPCEDHSRNARAMGT